MQDYVDKVIDLTNDSETTFMQHHVYCPYNNTIMTCNSQLTYLLKRGPEKVDDLPEHIDDMKIFKMKCSLREWVQKTCDLQFFKMHSSRRKGLIGTG